MSDKRSDMTKAERREADRKYAATRDRLNSYQPKGGNEDDEYLRRNQAVIDAEKSAGFWAKLRS
jgi:hypothetical protein